MNDADWLRKRFRGWAQGCSTLGAMVGFALLLGLVVF
jgi:hypothetical protein